MYPVYDNCESKSFSNFIPDYPTCFSPGAIANSDVQPELIEFEDSDSTSSSTPPELSWSPSPSPLPEFYFQPESQYECDHIPWTTPPSPAYDPEAAIRRSIEFHMYLALEVSEETSPAYGCCDEIIMSANQLARDLDKYLCGKWICTADHPRRSVLKKMARCWDSLHDLVRKSEVYLPPQEFEGLRQAFENIVRNLAGFMAQLGFIELSFLAQL